jgi:hypothetical protein
MRAYRFQMIQALRAIEAANYSFILEIFLSSQVLFACSAVPTTVRGIDSHKNQTGLGCRDLRHHPFDPDWRSNTDPFAGHQVLGDADGAIGCVVGYAGAAPVSDAAKSTLS